MSNITDAYLMTDKVALITGGGNGIGRETAIVLAAAGAQVIASDVDELLLGETRMRADEAGVRIATRLLDVTDFGAVTKTVDDIMSEYGRLDVLVNAAGIMIMRNALDVTADELWKVLRVNIGGTLSACQAAGRVMGPESTIINLASSVVDRASPGRLTYAISKGGVVQLTRTLALELGANGIRVNAIAPGWVETGMTDQHWTDADGTIDHSTREKYVATMGSASPIGRVGSVRDIALATLSLVSSAGAFVTGQVVRVNGGSYMG